MIITVSVKTNAKENKIIKQDETHYKVYIKTKPIKGKANMELIKVLKKHFKKNVEIISGKTSKKKKIKLS